MNAPTTRRMACVLLGVFGLLASVCRGQPQCDVDFVPSVYALQYEPGDVAAGDLNSDGFTDLVVLQNSQFVVVLLGNGDGTFRQPVSYEVAAGGRASLLVADMDGDGRPDVLVGGLGGVSILPANANGTLRFPVTFTNSGDAFSMAIGDFNGDGQSDIAVANGSAGTVTVLLRTGALAFGHAMSFSVGDGAAGQIVTGDFNHDGRPDLACANGDRAVTCVLLGDVQFPSRAFRPRVEYPGLHSGVGRGLVARADIDGDGNDDLIVAGYSNGTLMTLMGVGDGTFHLGTTFESGASTLSAVAVGDFSGDGAVDLALAASPPALRILVGNGDGTFRPSVAFPTGDTPRRIAPLNVNADGRTDVVLASTLNGRGRVTAYRSIPPTAPTITTQPRSGPVCATGALVLSVAAVGTAPLAYQWQWRPDPGADVWIDVVNGVNPPQGQARFSAQGATTPSLIRTAIAPSRDFTARCRIVNGCGATVSQAATVVINSADFNNDGLSGTTADIQAFFACLAGDCCATCGSTDFDGDGDVGTDRDIATFFRLLTGGSC
jgi:FG-GAP-like repeat